MEDCQECGGLITEGNECESCHTTVEVCLFISVIKVMSEKVKVYKDAMQERLQIIREDIISSITEETMKYQKILDSSLATLNNYMTELSEMDIKEGETKTIVSPEVILDS